MNQPDEDGIRHGLGFLILGHSDCLANSYDTQSTAPELSQGYEAPVGSVTAAWYPRRGQCGQPY